MRYNVVHLIRGEAKIFHEKITRDLTDTFGSYPIHEYIPPHLTLKWPFESDEEGLSAVNTVINSICQTHRKSDYHLRGFGHFENAAIYIDAIPSPEMKATVTDLQTKLAALPGIALNEFDTTQKFHASVAVSRLKPYSLEQLWEHLQKGPQPDFAMKFDNIALMKKVGNKWIVDRVTEIPESTS